MNNNSISIIIPAYNAEDYITKTIDSVIKQTYTNWELIVVDDGSTDRTANIIKEFCKNDNRVIYIYQKNTGVSHARNNGLKKAKGKFIALLDADDLWNNNKLESVLQAFLKNNIDWIFSDVIDLYEDGRESIKKIKETNNILESLLLWDSKVLTAPSGIVFKSHCYSKSLKFDKKFTTAADQDFVIQLASKYKGYHINSPLWKYRILENSMSHNISVMEKDHIGVFKKASKNKLFKSFWFKQICFSNLYWILAGSWWKDGNNKTRGIYFITRALLVNPFSISKIFSKKF